MTTVALAARLTSSRLPAAVFLLPSSCCRLPAAVCKITLPTFTSGPTGGRLVVVVFRGKRLGINKLTLWMIALHCHLSAQCRCLSVRRSIHGKHFGMIQLTSTLSWTPHLDSLLHFRLTKFSSGSVLPTTAEKNTFFCSLKLAWPLCGQCWNTLVRSGTRATKY